MHAKYMRLFTAASGMSRFEEIDIQVHPRFTLPPARPLSVAEPRVYAASRRGKRKMGECRVCRALARRRRSASTLYAPSTGYPSMTGQQEEALC